MDRPLLSTEMAKGVLIMRKITIGLLCILLIFTGCSHEYIPVTSQYGSPGNSKYNPPVTSQALPDKVAAIIPEEDASAPPASEIIMRQAREICMYNFSSFGIRPGIAEVYDWNKEPVVLKKWKKYYYSKHKIKQHPELTFYIFYDQHGYSINHFSVMYSYFVISTSSEDVSAIRVGDPYSKFQEQYGDFPAFQCNIELVHSDGKVLYCRFDLVDGELKVVDVRPYVNDEFSLMIKEILEFEATLE